MHTLVCSGKLPLSWIHWRCLQKWQGGLKGRSIKSKVVQHFDNPTTHDMCFVRLFKLYQSPNIYSEVRPNDSFYFHPLKEHIEGCWFQQNRLVVISSRAQSHVFAVKQEFLLLVATIHSKKRQQLGYQANIDEQLIMERTVHCSLDGVCEYKWTSNNQ